MWAIIEIIASLAIVLIFITEFFWPLISGKPIFGSFRKTSASAKAAEEDLSIEDKLAQAKAKAQEIKKIQTEIDEKLKTAEQLKAEADDLLK